MMREKLTELGFNDTVIAHYLKIFGDTWDDNYEIIGPNVTVKEKTTESFYYTYSAWAECPMTASHLTNDANIHRRLKPGLEKIEVKE